MHSWAEEWRFNVFERDEVAVPSIEIKPSLPSYEEQPEPVLAPIVPIRPQSDKASDGSQSEK